jgi:RNA polymerase sigma-70 factor (ECF subfamily)
VARANRHPQPPPGGSQVSAEEAALVAAARAGDRAAFEQLVRVHADRLHAVVLRFAADADEAEEVTQEAFLRAWRAIGRFRGESQFFTWLYRIGMNEARRRAARRPPAGQVIALADHPQQPADEGPGPARRLEQVELHRALEHAVRALPPDLREPLVLRDVRGLSTREAAAVMGLHEGAFKSRLHRARLAVRAQIADLLEPEP